MARRPRRFLSRSESTMTKTKPSPSARAATCCRAVMSTSCRCGVLVDITMSQNQITYDRLNVTLTRDDVMGESLYNPMLPGSSPI